MLPVLLAWIFVRKKEKKQVLKGKEVKEEEDERSEKRVCRTKSIVRPWKRVSLKWTKW